MVKSIRAVSALALAALLAGSVQTASAHAPIFLDSPAIETAYPVPDPTYQTGFYSALAYPGQTQYFRLDLAEPRAISIFLTVPNSLPCREFRPQVAIIGPGVSELTAFGAIVAPEGMSVLPVASPFWGRYVDADTRLAYFAGPRFYPELGAGTYYLAVTDEAGGVGNFVLLVGDLDQPATEPGWIEMAQAHHACEVVAG
jgi:hypothetical protein